MEENQACDNYILYISGDLGILECNKCQETIFSVGIEKRFLDLVQSIGLSRVIEWVIARTYRHKLKNKRSLENCGISMEKTHLTKRRKSKDNNPKEPYVEKNTKKSEFLLSIAFSPCQIGRSMGSGSQMIWTHLCYLMLMLKDG